MLSKRERDELRRLPSDLSRLEWKASYSYCTGWPACPMCKGIKPGAGADEDGNLPLNQGHKDGCALKLTLRALPALLDAADREERLREGLRAEAEALSETEFVEWSYNNAMAGFCHQLRERLTALLNDTDDQTAGGE